MASWSRDLEFGPVPGWLSDVVDIALADLQRPAPIDVRLGYEAGPGILCVSDGGERDRAGFESLGEARGAELLVTLADWLQEQFFHETRGAWGEPRPECPGHPHPAQGALISGEAWWVCPVDGGRIAPMGRIGR